MDLTEKFAEWQKAAPELIADFFPPNSKVMPINDMIELAPEFLQAMFVLQAGRLWAQPCLDKKTRSCLTMLTALVVLEKQAQMEKWIEGALHNGSSREEIIELFLHLVPAIGLPIVGTAFEAAKRVFDAQGLQDGYTG